MKVWGREKCSYYRGGLNRDVVLIVFIKGAQSVVRDVIHFCVSMMLEPILLAIGIDVQFNTSS